MEFIYTSTDFLSPRTCPTDHGRPRYAPGATAVGTAVRVAYDANPTRIALCLSIPFH